MGWHAVGEKSICQEGAPCPNLILVGSSQLAQRVSWVQGWYIGRRFFVGGKVSRLGWWVWLEGIYIYIYMMGKDLGLDDF